MSTHDDVRIPLLRRIGRGLAERSLLLALILWISASIGLVGVSVYMYYAGGYARYDLSRPAYEKERSELAKPEPQKSYDTTSPLTKKAINDFLQEFDTRQKDLQAYGDFHDTSLSDEELQIVNEGE